MVYGPQQITAEWNAWLASAPPKNSSPRTCTPNVLAPEPGMISTVAGEYGTPVLTDPRVAIAAPAGGEQEEEHRAGSCHGMYYRR